MTSPFQQISQLLIRRQIPNPDLNYEGFTPSFGGNLAISIIFGVLCGINFILCRYYKQKWFLSCWFIGLTLECLGYAGRCWSAKNLDNNKAFAMQLLCITIAPRFFMAGIYFLVAQVTIIHGEQFSLLKPMQYSLIFIISDMIAIILQATGAGIATSSNAISVTRGVKIMLAGLCFQIASIVLFQCFWNYFTYNIWKSYKAYGDSEFEPQYAILRAKKIYAPYVCAISLTVIFIFIRSCYRVAKLSNGWLSRLAYDETYDMILEALMMLLACSLLTILHPGIVYGHNEICVDTSFKSNFISKAKYNRTNESISEERLELRKTT